jgi:hypothetical protein
MGKCKSICAAFTVLCLVAAGVFWWMRMPVSDQELLANFAKAGDFFRGVESVRGLPWWSPSFLQGTSLAMAWGYMFSNVVMLAATLPFGFLAGSKVAVGCCLLAGAAGMYFFLRRWNASELAAWIGAVLFLLNPSVLTRAVGFEHFVVVVSLAVLPWVFWALLGLVRGGTARSALVFGVCFSLLALAYGKTGLMALPVLGVFAAVEHFSRARAQRTGWRIWALAAGVVLVLAVLPNLPALREAGLVAMFEFGPFEGWQRAFSTKSALSWLDRGGMPGEGMDSGFAPTTLNGGTYLGWACGALLAVALWRGVLHSGAAGRAARLLLALAMGAFWLSFGPRSVMGGHFEFLRMSMGAADFTPAMAWFLLLVQVWVIFRLVPQESMPWRWAAVGFSLVYLFLPGFRLLEFLPIYRNIRAPFDFYQVTGSICLVGAVAMTAGVLLEKVRWGILRRGLAVAFVVLVVFDVAPYARPLLQERIGQGVWRDFLEVQEFLKTAPEPGRVYGFSGRYFYMMTPWLSGRPLAAEAFNSYLQQRGAAILQASAFLNDERMESYFRVAGVAYLLVDKTDPDTKPDMQTKLRGIFPVAFENENMVLLGVRNPLGYGFLARDFLQTGTDAPETAIAAIGGAEHNLAMIQTSGLSLEEPGLRGKVINGRIAASEGKVLEKGRPFIAVPRGEEVSYQSAAFGPAGESGWLIFNEAWHPDWTAREGAEERKVHRAMLAFSCVQTTGETGVTFAFRQPWWYNICIWASLVGWLAAVLALRPRSGPIPCHQGRSR